MTKIEKAVKTLGVETVNEMEAMDSTSLKKRVVEASEAMRMAEEELEANEKYIALKESLKALTAGKRDLDKRQKAVICLALSLLHSQGEVSNDA